MGSDSSPRRRKSDARSLVFGEFELDRSARQLLRDGRPIELSARSFDLLCFLIDNAERAVSRQELLDELWGDRVVTDNTLSQLVSSLRRSLGDSADQAQYIRTVHGYGLQWAAQTENQAHADLIEDAEPSVSAARPRANRWLLWLILLALVGLLIATLMSLRAGREGNAGSTQPVAALPTRQPGQIVLAILPIQSDQQAESELLGLSIADYLTQRLRSLPGISVLEPAELRRILAQPDLDSVRKKVDPDFVFEARLVSTAQPERATFQARIVPRGGQPTVLADRPLALPDIPNDFAYFYNARQALVEEVGQIVAPGTTLPPLGESQPTDPEALKIALSADRVLRSTLCDHEGLDLQLQSAIATAPDSAYLWWLLGNHYFTRVWGCGEPVTLLEQAFAAAARADQLAPGRYQAAAQLRHTYLLETAQAEEAYGFALEGDLREPDTQYRVALSLRYAGFVDAARQRIEALLEQDGLYFYQGRYGRAPNSLLYAAAYAEFLATIPASGPYHSYYHGFVELLRGNVAESERILNTAFADFPSDMFGSLSRALLAHLAGDNRLAVEVVRQVAAGRARLPLRDGEVTYKQAQLLALAGDLDGALLALEQTIEQGFFCARCFEEDSALQPLRERDAFRGLVNRAGERHQRFAARFDLPVEWDHPNTD